MIDQGTINLEGYPCYQCFAQLTPFRARNRNRVLKVRLRIDYAHEHEFKQVQYPACPASLAAHEQVRVIKQAPPY